MDEIYRLDSDAALQEELSECIKNRQIEQKFIYQWVWADLYYDDIIKNKIYTESDLSNKCFLDFFNKNIWNNKEIDLISLGCGMSNIEKYLFENLGSPEKISYVGVDSSKKMLDLSINNLKNIKTTKKKFICADFSKKIFKSELSDFSDKNRLFVFFSNTFWNIKPTNIIDMLGNLLHKKERIWLDVRVRSWTSIQDDFNISDIINENMKTEERKNTLYKIIDDLWIDRDNVELITQSKKESFVNALKVNFSYLFKKKTEIDLKGEKIFILPWESIQMLSIYHFDPKWLESFFHEHGFKLLDKEIKGYRGQFLFEKEE